MEFHDIREKFSLYLSLMKAAPEAWPSGLFLFIALGVISTARPTAEQRLMKRLRLIENFSGIQDVVRVELSLDSAHQIDRRAMLQ